MEEPLLITAVSSITAADAIWVTTVSKGSEMVSGMSGVTSAAEEKGESILNVITDNQ